MKMGLEFICCKQKPVFKRLEAWNVKQGERKSRPPCFLVFSKYKKGRRKRYEINNRAGGIIGCTGGRRRL